MKFRQLFGERQCESFRFRPTPIVDRHTAVYPLKDGEATAEYLLRWFNEERSRHFEAGAMRNDDRWKLGNNRRSDSARVITADGELLRQLGNALEREQGSLLGTSA